MDKIYIVSVIHGNNPEPMVAAFDNEDAAMKCRDWYMGKVDYVFLDPCDIYSTFTTTEEESNRAEETDQLQEIEEMNPPSIFDMPEMQGGPMPNFFDMVMNRQFGSSPNIDTEIVDSTVVKEDEENENGEI